MKRKIDAKNRFLKYSQEGQKAKLAALIFLVLISLGLFIEVCLATAFVSRTYVRGQEIEPMFERYFILKPFKYFVHSQELLSIELNRNYIGLTEPVLDTMLAYSPDPLLGHRLRPDVSWSPFLGTVTTTNSQGFVTTYKDLRTFDYIPAQDTFRIVFLGGSTVEGWGAKNSLYSLPAIFADQIAMHYLPNVANKNRFEVINAGVSDYDSRNEFLYYANELLKYKPHLVISYNGGNDSMNMASTNLVNPNSLETEGYRMNKQILENSYSVSSLLMRALQLSAQELVFFFKRIFVTDIFFKLAEMISSRTGNTNDLSGADRPEISDIKVSIYLKNVMRLQRELEASGTHFAWFIQPNLFVTDYQPQDTLTTKLKKYESKLQHGLYEFYSAADQALRNQKAGYGASSVFCAANVSDALNGSNEEVYLDQIHLNEAGNRKMVERLLQELKSCNLIKKAKQS